MKTETREVTKEQLLQEAEELASSVLNTTAADAFLRLEQGEFRGTIFASKMAAIRFLLQVESPLPAAAE